MQLSDFKTYAKRDIKRTDKDTELVQAYNDAIMWIAAIMPNANYKYQSYINTVVAQEDYALPTDMMHLYHPIRLLEGSATTDSGWPLGHITKEEYDIIEPNPNRTSPSTGEPTKYTIFSRSILLYPVPDKTTYILEINWAKKGTAQSADTDTHSFGTEWDEILKWATLERLYDGLGMHDEALYYGSKIHDQYGQPIGYLKTLLDREKDIERYWIGSVQNNEL